MVVASALAGRSFFVWAQKAMVKRWTAWEEQDRELGDHSGRLVVVFAAAAFGAILGPALGRAISSSSALLLGLVALMAFFTGWALAPDLSTEVRRKYWQRVAGKEPGGPPRS